ncbi:MAG: hypothetical protein KF878_21250 [Planctomycetes bacterium]|nr:hypothetical protein [Planctomycetota bacterium]
MPRTRAWLALALVPSLAACGGGGGSPAQVAPGSAAAAPVITGRLAGAPAGAVVHLVAPEAVVPGGGLLGHAAAIVGTVDLEPDGSFVWVVEPDLPRPTELIVSAPGHALARAALGVEALDLAPEAVVEVRALAPGGGPEVDAVALVLDAGGAPVPVPPDGLGAGSDGLLRAARLPAGAHTLLIESADGRRHAAVDVRLVAGERVALEVRLGEDPDAEQRFREALLGVDDEELDR